MTELIKLLDRLGVNLVVKDIPSIPARLTITRPWRTTLIRTIGRGKNAQELRYTTTMLSSTKPTTEEVVNCLLYDADAGELKLWDFAQSFTGGAVNSQTEYQRKACRKVGKRAKRFFGDEWENVVRAEQGLPPLAKTGRGEKHAKKSA